MAYAERAYYEQENNFGVTDRLEIHEDGFSGTAIELGGRAPLAFDFEHRESTSTQRDYLSIFENQIIMGVLDLYAWIDTEAKETLVTDIADAPTKQFQVRWKRGGTTVWYGFPYGRIVEYPDKPQYNVKIQFRDFEILKGKDYALDDTRQKIITTFSDLFGELGFGNSIFTATSWQEENTTTSDDFLNQVYHDTYTLRDFNESDSTEDDTITYYDALLRTAEPQLLIYQWEGFRIHQISGLKSPSSVLLSEYNSSGVQQSSASTDLRQTIYMQEGANTPWAKNISNNTSYPAIKRVSSTFKHQSGSSDFTFETSETGLLTPVIVDQDDGAGNREPYYRVTKPFSGNGDEHLEFGARCYKIGSFDANNSLRDWARLVISVGDYVLNGSEWLTTSELFTNFPSRMYWEITNMSTGVNATNGNITWPIEDGSILVTEIKHKPVRLLTTGTLPDGWEENTTYYVVGSGGGLPSSTDDFYISTTPGGSPLVPNDVGTGTMRIIVVDIARKMFEQTRSIDGVDVTYTFGSTPITTGDIPDAAEGDFEIVLMSTIIFTPAQDYDGDYVEWANVSAVIINPTQAGAEIEYRLTQGDDYPDYLRLPDHYYGDGPYPFARSAYRFSTTQANITTGWRRRGETTYQEYSRLRVREVLDFQRSRQYKKQFELWGEFEPDKVSVYDSENWMYVGGRYNGRWAPICIKINEELDV